MLPELEKYKNSNNFSFTINDNIRHVCNAPSDMAGIYVLYALKNNKRELVYIGRSGQLKADGKLFIRQGGIADRLINGKRDGELRREHWKREMIKEKIEALIIHWYVTHDDKEIDCPSNIEKKLISAYKPRWNRT